MSLHIITGPMFAGKSSYLLDLYSHCPHPKILIKPHIDTRYSTTHVSSHNGHLLPATVVSEHSNIYTSILPKSNSHIFIDEGQFFSQLHSSILSFLQNGHHVTVAALNGDYKQDPFIPISSILPLSNKITLLHANCTQCSSPAHFTHRKCRHSETILLGSSETYQPLCFSCLATLYKQF